MKKYLPVIAVVIAFSASVFGQQATPTPKPAAADDTDVVKISTNLIQLDMSVTDSKGKVVTDIRPDEVEIYENGHKQNISGFSFISSVRETIEKPTIVDKNAPPPPPTELRAEKVRRTIALVVDDLSLSFESAYQTRLSLKKFVDDQMQPGDLVAIIRTGAGIGSLQQFTSDKRILYAAIERVRWNPQGGGGIGAFAPIEAAPDTSLRTDPTQPPDETATGNSGESLDDFRGRVFATGTLGALKYVVTGMAELPGRKTVILFSDGFKLFEKDSNGFQESSVVMDFMRQLVDAANRSSVVFYTVDPRGLQTLGFTAQDSVTDTSPDAMNAARNARRDQLLDTQEGLDFLASETGGFAVKNSNDLIGGVRRVLDDQSYYLVAYEPDADTFDPVKRKYNKIVVKVRRHGVSVRYRSGFFNVAEREAPVTPVNLTRGQKLQKALTSPFGVNGISLKLNALFGNDAVRGSYVRSILHVDGNDLKLVDDKDGAKKATIEILAASFGDNGLVIDQLAKSYTLTVPAKNVKRFVAEGFIYDFTFPVNKPGAYQYRVALRDAEGDAIGSASQFIEVPNLKKNRLTVSSIVLQDLTVDQWNLIAGPNGRAIATNSLADTALRRIKIGTILRYGYEIYNAKLDASKHVGLKTRIRVFHDGKLVLDGEPHPFDFPDQLDPLRLKSAGALTIGGKMVPGDYILQVIVVDELAGKKQQMATQSIQFEVER